MPNDGTFDNASEQIQFRAKQDWDFPVGTVFIKLFDMPLTIGEGGPSQRLETRFFVIGEDNRSYGLTYKWNEEGTEAFLQGGGSAKTFSITDENGQFAYEQAWDYPSRNSA